MRDESCNYDQAVTLNRLGFDWKCEDRYIDNERNHKHEVLDWVIALEEKCLCDTHTDIYLAPSQTKAQRWLREVKKLDVLVYNCSCGYGWEISKAGDEQTRGTTVAQFDDKGDDEASGMWNTYESALSAGITECLRLLENNEI